MAEVGGAAAGARILSAAPIDQATVESLFADRIAAGTEVALRSRDRHASAPRTAGGSARSCSRAARTAAPIPAAIEAALLEGVRAHGLGLLPWSEARPVAAHAAPPSPARLDPALPDLSDEALLARARRLAAAAARRQAPARRRRSRRLLGRSSLLGWEGRKAVDRLAPSHFETPAGSRHPIDYEAEGGPDRHGPGPGPVRPRRPSRRPAAVPLVLALTSPAGRPIQTTRDLPGFWRGSWAAVAKEMRGRYPKHPWPDDPAAADPTLKTKKARCSADDCGGATNLARPVNAPTVLVC